MLRQTKPTSYPDVKSEWIYIGARIILEFSMSYFAQMYQSRRKTITQKFGEGFSQNF